MESPTRVATTSHFLLMFGYKLFSFFFPLYLIQQGFSLPQVGYIHLLVYLPIALFAPIAGQLNRYFRPGTLALFGIVGYAAYSLTLLGKPEGWIFYGMQVVLGIAAACFFVSMRSLLMGSQDQNPDKAFGYFYSAPTWAEAVAPAVGAGLIFLTGFRGVFIVSLIVHGLNMVYLFMKQPLLAKVNRLSLASPTFKTYQNFFRTIFSTEALPILALAFVILLIGGLYQPFFVIFLERLGWDQNMILFYGAIFSALFVPVSYLAIRYGVQGSSRRNIFWGSAVFAVGSILFGLLSSRLEFLGILVLALIRGAGGLVVNAGRSGYLTRQFPKFREVAGVIDTMASPLGIAIGATCAGLLLTRVDFSSLFIQAGVLVIGIIVLIRLQKRKHV